MINETELEEDLINIKDNVNLVDDPIFAPISLALCTRIKRKLPQVNFSKDISGELETIELSYKFDVAALHITGKDPLSEMLQVITDECIIKFTPYTQLTINFCGVYPSGKIGELKVIFKIVK